MIHRDGRRFYLLLGALSLAGYSAASLLVSSDHSNGDFLLFLGLFGGLSAIWGAVLYRARHTPPPLLPVIVCAVLFRLVMLPSGYDFDEQRWQRVILYDDDVWRYLWEGHVWSAGVNPLQVSPEELEEYQLELDDPHLHGRLYSKAVFSDIYDNVSYRQFASPYSFAAQAVFRLAHVLRPGSLLVFRLLIITCDLGALLLMVGICRRLGDTTFPVLAYGWCPLVVKELAGSAHIDAMLVVLLLFGIWSVLGPRRATSGIWLAAAALVKPTPLVLAPAFLKRIGWYGIFPVAAAVAVIGLALPEGMKAYAADWYFNGAFTRFLPDGRIAALALPMLAVGTVALVWFLRDDGSPGDLIRQGLWLFGAFLLTTPMAAPWYFVWIVPFAALRRSVFWLTMSGTVFLSYHAYLNFEENPWLLTLEYAIPMIVHLGRRYPIGWNSFAEQWAHRLA